MTLEEAQRNFEEGLDKGTICPCCKRYAKVYKRKLNQRMALALIDIYLQLRRLRFGTYLHVNNMETAGASLQNREFSKLRYWGLIKADLRRDGYWTITRKGIKFAQGGQTVPNHIVLRFSELLRFEGHLITIREALGEQFSLEELLTD